MPQDLDNLEKRIKSQKKKEALAQKSRPTSEVSRAAQLGLRMGTELLSGVVVGAAVGYLLDNFLHTKPWLLIIFLFLGSIAGFLNVYRVTKKEEKDN